jgi:hypothetical protein
MANGKCSHAGPVTFDTPRDGLPALADACGWAQRVSFDHDIMVPVLVTRRQHQNLARAMELQHVR